MTDIGTASDDKANAVALQKDGKLVVVGSTDAGGNSDFMIARYTANGTLDGTFGIGGKVRTDMGATTYDYAYAVAIQKNGRIVVSGVSYAPSGDFAVARYLANGTLDSTFGTGGKVVSDLGTASDDEARAEAIQKDGKILVGGYRHASGNFDFAVARYTTLGVLDSTLWQRRACARRPRLCKRRRGLCDGAAEGRQDRRRRAQQRGRHLRLRGRPPADEVARIEWRG